MKKRLLFEVTGVVKAPVEEVADLMFASGPPSGVHTDADRATNTISYWGNWWYRGEDSVEPHPEGALLVHRVYNIARQGNWAAYLANKLFIGYRATLERSMRDRVADYQAKLDYSG